MDDTTEWKNVREHAAFNRLSDLLPVLQSFRLADTAEALEATLKGRRERGRWNWGVFEHFVNRFESEFSAQDATYGDGFAVLKEVLNRAFETKRKKAKRMNLFEVAWSDKDEFHMAATL